MSSRWLPISGSQLIPDMIIRKWDDTREYRIGKYTGECTKGIHFGAGCYDRIGRWLVKREDKS